MKFSAEKTHIITISITINIDDVSQKLMDDIEEFILKDDLDPQIKLLLSNIADKFYGAI